MKKLINIVQPKGKWDVVSIHCIEGGWMCLPSAEVVKFAKYVCL